MLCGIEITREQIEALPLEHIEALAEAWEQWPFLSLYQPHPHGQQQFHRAEHVFRICAPGNGWGKTAAIAAEVGYWIAGFCPILSPDENRTRYPQWPRIINIVVTKFDHWEKIRKDWEKFWPKGWSFNGQRHVYTWPDGSQCFLISGEGDWKNEQGTNPDLIAFDETCPASLWRELRMRRRGQRKTRFIFAATQTQGLTWMYTDLYQPWLQWHAKRGYTEDMAVDVQGHEFDDPELAGVPGIWCWPYGGAGDNPANSAQDVALYRQATFGSDIEKAVRMQGGFRDFSGKPVFPLDRLEEQVTRKGEEGSLEDDWVCNREGVWNAGTEGTHVVFRVGLTTPAGRIVRYEPPLPGERYVLAFDAAYGIEGKDLDCVHVLNRAGEQVCVAHGSWGNATRPGLSRIAARLHYYYNGAFVGAERQVGLVHLRELWDCYGITYQYRSRKEEEGGRRRQDALGHARTHDDVAMGLLRTMLAEPAATRQIHIYDEETLRQLKRYQFRSRKASIDVAAARDAELSMGAPEGDHDDTVTSLAVAVLMLREVPFFEAERPQFARGTYGASVQADFDKMHSSDDVVAPDPFA